MKNCCEIIYTFFTVRGIVYIIKHPFNIYRGRNTLKIVVSSCQVEIRVILMLEFQENVDHRSTTKLKKLYQYLVGMSRGKYFRVYWVSLLSKSARFSDNEHCVLYVIFIVLRLT